MGSRGVIAAAVAPTDAALGAQVVEDRHVPHRIRRVLNVESGLNDGIATPFVSFFIAGAVADIVSHSSANLGGALGDLGIGAFVGAGIGLGGGLLVTLSTGYGWSSPNYRGIGALALALGAYALSVELGGNGFIAAFVGGLAIGTVLPDRQQEATLDFDAQAGELPVPSGLVPLRGSNGAGARQHDMADRGVRGTGTHRRAHGTGGLFAARRRSAHSDDRRVRRLVWTRGLASVVFGLIAFDSLHGPDAETVLTTITLTVLLSVLAAWHHRTTILATVRRSHRRARQRSETRARPRSEARSPATNYPRLGRTVSGNGVGRVGAHVNHSAISDAMKERGLRTPVRIRVVHTRA